MLCVFGSSRWFLRAWHRCVDGLLFSVCVGEWCLVWLHFVALIVVGSVCVPFLVVRLSEFRDVSFSFSQLFGHVFPCVPFFVCTFALCRDCWCRLWLLV